MVQTTIIIEKVNEAYLKIISYINLYENKLHYSSFKKFQLLLNYGTHANKHNLN